MNIPFYPNTGDGTHCFQAALKMTLAYFSPDREFTYEELDEISQKVPGKWTWPTAAMLWLMQNGYELRLVEEFDYAEFAKRGSDYLIDKSGHEVAEVQAENSDIDREREIAKNFVQYAPLERRIPDLKDIKRYLEENWVVMCNVNSALLQDRHGYSGHFVVIIDVKDDEVVIHDPGLPPLPNLAVEKEVFEKAWAYPAESDKNLLAIRILP
jgi:hypothetical protein